MPRLLGASQMTFSEAVGYVLEFEKGYVNDPHDPGGETKFGISKRSYPDINIKEISRDEAIEIYKKDYWLKIKAEFLPQRLRLLAFDCAVNQGAVRAIKILQRCLKIEEDGVFGEKTGRAILNFKDTDLTIEYAKIRLHYYTQNRPKWMMYGVGWMRRLLEISLVSALSDEGESQC